MININYDINDMLKTNINDNILKNTLSYEKPFNMYKRENIDLDTVGLYGKVLSDFVNIAFNGISCNPSKQEIVELSKLLFINNIGDASLFNTQVGMNAFKDYLVDNNQSKYCVISGKRGKGKTNALNHFLNVETRNLSNKDNLVWFNIDMAQVYKICPLNKIDIAYYLYSQIVYVFFKYTENEVIFNKITKDSNFIKALLNFNEEYINDLKQFIKLGKKSKPIYSSKRFPKTDIQKIALLILKFIKIYKYNLALFIDGVDNIDYMASVDTIDNNSYKIALRQIKSLTTSNNLGLVTYFDKFILLGRNETIKLLEEIEYPARGYDNLKTFSLLDIDPLYIIEKAKDIITNKLYLKNRILKKRFIKFARTVEKLIGYENKLGKNSKLNKRRDAIIRILLNEFYEYCIEYENRINKVLNKFLEPTITREYSLKTIIFNDSLREYLHNMVSGYSHLRAFSFEYSHMRAYCIKRNFLHTSSGQILLESIFMDGKLFIEQRPSSSFLNYQKNTINFFNASINLPYNSKYRLDELDDIYINQSNKYYLVIYHILVYLKEHKILSLEQLSAEMRLFNYSNDLIKVNLYRLVEYGFIERTHDYEITIKGESYIELICKNPNLFYLMALDTNIPNILKKYIEVHKQDQIFNKYWINYPSSILRTNLTFKRLLRTSSESLIKIYKKNSFYDNDVTKYNLIIESSFLEGMTGYAHKVNNIILNNKDNLYNIIMRDQSKLN